MKEYLKNIIRHSPLYSQWKKVKQAKELKEWENSGRPIPPPHIIKQRTLRNYSERYGLSIMVETGTYNGGMINAMKSVFDYIYSIELSKELYEKARKRFEGQKHIEILHGDSGKEINSIMCKIECPTLFWLDAHYSGGVTARGNEDSPIYKELHSILNAPDRGHVIIIDDARNFGTDPAYPTMEDLNEFINSKRANLDIIVEDDIIRVTPKQ